MKPSQSVLVLNQNFEPLNVCNLERALRLVLAAKAEVLEQRAGVVHSVTHTFPAPSVIRLAYQVRRPVHPIGLSRRAIFLRDSYTCQYCGTRPHVLTLDHVVPKSRGGRNTWENMVTACGACNHRKGGRTLQEVRMRLLREPRAARVQGIRTVAQHMATTIYAEWVPYLPGL
jgi:5-methylcytosine-specific restriction endonuclease McrA